MKYLIWILLVFGLLANGFSYWGLETPGGQAQFDEMAGIIPLVVGMLGKLAIVVAIVITGVVFWRARRNGP